MKKPKGMKKQRGKRNKKWFREFSEWYLYQKENAKASVSDITPDGFMLHIPSGDYYILREKFPYFKDASDEGLKKINITLDFDEYHGDTLDWPILDIQIGSKQLVGK